MNTSLQILHLEDDPADARIIRETLKLEGVDAEITLVSSRAAFTEAVEHGTFDIVLADYKLPAFDGLQALSMIRLRHPALPFIFVTGALGEERAVETLKSGATDFIVKGNSARLASAVQRALAEADEQRRRRRAEEALFAAQRRLQAIMQAVPVGISYSDDATCRTISGNPAVLAQFEVAPSGSAVLPENGRLARYFRGGREIPDVDLPLQRAVAENREIPPVELEIELPSGRRWYTQSSGAPIRDQNGHIIGGVAVTVDITERKRVEENLQRTADELARSNKELEQFAYVASHDLQEPLRMISSFVSLLLDHYKDRMDDEAREYFSFVSDGAERMRVLINALLEYARVGSNVKERVPVSAQDSLDRALAALRTGISECGAKITFDGMPTVAANGVQFTQLFQNLLCNALKFRGNTKPEIHVSAKRYEASWLFSVKDNGIGIDPEFADKIFEIFQRLHTRMEYSGTGVGLAICKKIVERYGGRIWVESEPGKGATFYFTVPDLSPAMNATGELVTKNT